MLQWKYVYSVYVISNNLRTPGHKNGRGTEMERKEGRKGGEVCDLPLFFLIVVCQGIPRAVCVYSCTPFPRRITAITIRSCLCCGVTDSLAKLEQVNL